MPGTNTKSKTAASKSASATSIAHDTKREMSMLSAPYLRYRRHALDDPDAKTGNKITQKPSKTGKSSSASSDPAKRRTVKKKGTTKKGSAASSSKKASSPSDRVTSKKVSGQTGRVSGDAKTTTSTRVRVKKQPARTLVFE